MTRYDKMWQDTIPVIDQVTFKATNHDGRAATITAPNGTAQQHLGINKSIGHRFCMSTFHMKIQVFPSFPLNLSSLGANFMSGVCFVQRLQKEPLHRRQKITGHMKNNMNVLWHDILFPKSVDKFAIWSLWGHQLPWMPRNWHGLGRSHRGRPVASHGAVVHPFAVMTTWKVGAQKAVYGKSQSSFALAAGKTNLGHLEGRKRRNLWNTAVPWNSMKGHMKHHETSCWVGKWTLSILSTNTAKSLWLFAPGAAGVAGLSKAAWSSSCSSPSPDPTQCRRMGCDCHRSCRVNEHKCQHCYGSASAALKIWIKQKTELAHWQIR